MDAKFEYAVQRTLLFEGGYANDPRDRGGETKFGISKRSYPELDIANLTLDRAKEIYFRDFWRAPGIWRVDDREIAAKVFDFGVTAGPRKAVRTLQEALALLGVELQSDGVLGPATAAAVNMHRNQEALLAAMRFLAAQHYVICHEPHYLAGRLTRAMS